jgi:hypothetical protein
MTAQERMEHFMRLIGEAWDMAEQDAGDGPVSRPTFMAHARERMAQGVQRVLYDIDAAGTVAWREAQAHYCQPDVAGNEHDLSRRP